jgi:hypothetical protein
VLRGQGLGAVVAEDAGDVLPCPALAEPHAALGGAEAEAVEAGCLFGHVRRASRGEAGVGELDGRGGAVAADEAAAELGGGDEGGAGAAEEVGDEVAGVGAGGDDAAQQAGVFLGGPAGLLAREAFNLDRVEGVLAAQRELGLVGVPHVLHGHAAAARRLAVAAEVALGVRDVLLVEGEARGVAGVKEEEVVVADPVVRAGLEAGEPADPPHDLALEAGRSEDLVEDQLGVVADGGIDVEVEAAVRGEQAVGEAQARLQHAQEAGEAAGPAVVVGVGLQLLALRGAALADAGVHEVVAGGEGGIEVDEVDGAGVGREQGVHRQQVVGADQEVRVALAGADLLLELEGEAGAGDQGAVLARPAQLGPCFAGHGAGDGACEAGGGGLDSWRT